ncbi:hypothetical protein Vafri_7339 [Volvox africanus]|uniref:Uncharacterized protein n=1 Tax=Volvox africanus TaxID=51714 RepID=A0A8J4B017_9CHLO|nr:hypothetical protein Vafri_7339 [Volvox africanus]
MQACSSFQDSFIAHNSADSPLLGVGCEDFGSSSDNDRLKMRHGNALGRSSAPFQTIRPFRSTSMDGGRTNVDPSNSGHGLKCSRRGAPNSSCYEQPADEIASHDYDSRLVPSASPCGDGMPPLCYTEAFTIAYGVDQSALLQDVFKTNQDSTMPAANIPDPIAGLSKALHGSRSSSRNRTFRLSLAVAPLAASASESSATRHASLDLSSEQGPIGGKEMAGVLLPPSSSSTSNHPLFDGSSATAAAATAAAGTSGLNLPIRHRLRAAPYANPTFICEGKTQSMARATIFPDAAPRLAAGLDLVSFPAPLASCEAIRGQVAAAASRLTHPGRHSFDAATSHADGGGGGSGDGSGGGDLSECFARRALASSSPIRLGRCSSRRTPARGYEVSSRLLPCRTSTSLPYARVVGVGAQPAMWRPPRLRRECSFDWGLQLPRWEEASQESSPHSTVQFEEHMARMNREAWNPRPFRPVRTPAALLGRWLPTVTACGELSAMTLAAATGRGPGHVAAKLWTNVPACEPRVSLPPPPSRAVAPLPINKAMPAAAAIPSRPRASASGRIDLAVMEPSAAVAAAAASSAGATDAAAAAEHSAQAAEAQPSASVRLQMQAMALTSLSPPVPQQYLEVEMVGSADRVLPFRASFPDADATAAVGAPQVPSVPSKRVVTSAAVGGGKKGRARPNSDLGCAYLVADETMRAAKGEETATLVDCAGGERGLGGPGAGALLATLTRLAAEGLPGRGGGGGRGGAGAAAPAPGPPTSDAGVGPAADSHSILRYWDAQSGEGSKGESSARSRGGSGGAAAADGVGGISCTSARKRALGEVSHEAESSSLPHPILRRELLLSAIEEQLQLKPLAQAIV